MAKQKIDNYVFLPGKAKSSNLYPNAYTLINENKSFIIQETIANINAQIAADNASNFYPNAVSQLTNNKAFVIDEIIAWIANRYTRTVTATSATGNTITVSSTHFYSAGDPVVFASNVGGLTSGTTYYVLTTPTGTTFTVTATQGSTSAVTLTNTSGQSVSVAYTYSESSCRRDTGYLIDAIIYDVRYGGNEKVINFTKNLWQGGTLQLYTPSIEIAGFNQVFTILTDYIIPKTAYSSQQSPVTSTQNTTGTAGESGVATSITTNLKPIVSNAISGGLSTLPTLQYSPKEYAGYVYDSNKCVRDIGYVIDAYLNDLRYGGNSQTRTISSRFWRNEEPQLSGDRRPEIIAQQWLANLIIQTILTQGGYTPLQNTVPRYTDGGITFESGSDTRVAQLSSIVTDVLTNGLSSLPALVNGVTTIKLQGKFDNNQILLITNTTKNTILYNFSDPTNSMTLTTSTGYVSNDYWQDDDFKSYRNIADYVTTLVFDFDTSTHSITDDIQIFIDQKELRVRPYDYGVDAIERHRVALPESMLDADFEYGLQPTKWQAIGLSRGYPSVYEIPGTDTPVSSVTTDASTGSGNVGQSLITVTTVGPHSVTAGSPITIKSLSNSVSGFSRAEGTFIVNSTPSNNTFTYYSQSKVGTANGQVLATTYTQLRRAAFYTGASVGSPSFSVVTNGSSTTFQTKFITAIGSDQIAFIGTAPSIGSPLTGTGIATGTQVTGIVGTGGIANVVEVETDTSLGSTSVPMYYTDSTDILEGMAVDNGSGTAIFVTNVVGNVITFSGPITTALKGNTASYTNISGSNVQPIGESATFQAVVSGNLYTSITVTSPGQNYRVNEKIRLYGDTMAGLSPDNDVIITITSVNALGGITGITYGGIASGVNGTYSNLNGVNQGPAGINATWDITRSHNRVYTVTLNQAGVGYISNERIKILGTSLGGTTPGNDLIITITGLSNGNISTFTWSGTPVTGSVLTFYSALTFSEVTTASIPDNTTINSTAIALIEVSFTSPHGLVPGTSIIVDITSTGSNHDLAQGPFYVEKAPTSTTIRYTARTSGNIDTSTNLSGIVYTRSDAFFIHRPYDGGVMLGSGGPQHGAQAIRMSKKYIRYQSGKGINYCTGALFAPSFNIQSATATGVDIGSVITFTMDDVDHGCQVGGTIKISGILTKGYNGTYVVSDIVNERQLRVTALYVLENTTAILSINAQLSLYKWHGATVRAGTFDDQNGLYFYYDGQDFGVGRRTATFQIAGTVDIVKDTNLMTGTNTRFRDQVHAGDRIVIKGMTHVVTNVLSQTKMTVAPDYRGSVDAIKAKVCLIQEFNVKQRDFNIDRLDGTGPSGYDIDITKMQMVGMQWSWYAVGFIDFMLRGSDGNFIFFHRIRNSNVNTEAYMRTGNQPVRYEVQNESAKSVLKTSISATATTLPLEDASDFPNESGVVIVDNELIGFTGKSGNNLINCTRATPLVNFVGGAQRTFTGSTATTHEFNTGVVLVSNTISPIISHWGSAMLTDGSFDEDRGYLFNYAATNILVTTTKQTAFLIRLAPSVSNAIVGDLGERELLNRAQLLLNQIEITADASTGGATPQTLTGGIVIEGVLNPQNFPTDPGLVAWTGLQGAAVGGQPSFAQIAPGGSITWSTSATVTDTPITTQASMTGSITARAESGNAGASGNNYVWLRQDDYLTYINTNGLSAGDAVSGTGIGDGATVTSFNGPYSWGVNRYYVMYLSVSNSANVPNNTSLTITRTFKTSNTSTIFFPKATWENSGAKSGTQVQDAKFPANTFVNSATLITFFSTQYYRVTFSQTSNATTITAGTTQVTFRFSQPAYALPGETVFSFIAAAGTNSSLDLTELKELTNTTLGGRGTYPNGPDVLAINVYKAAGSDIPCNIVLRWGEAQA